MKKFVFVYKGNGSKPADTMESVMNDWMNWMAGLGSAIVDGGNPFNDGGKVVTKSGVVDVVASGALSGYTIVNAEGIDEVVEMAKSCPIHTQEGGVASVEVYEALPM